MIKKNGVQIAKELVSLANDWVATKPLVPVKTDGTVNITELANILGTDRKRFSTNEALKETINSYLEAQGVPLIGSCPPPNARQDDKTISELKRENKRLSERLVAMQAQLKQITDENLRLKRKLSSFQYMEESQSFDVAMILDNGRLPR